MTTEREYHEVYERFPFMFPRPHRLPVDDNMETRYWDAFAFARAHEIRFPHHFAVLNMVKESLR